MKQKLLNSIRLRALLLVATLLIGGGNFNQAWAEVVTYTVSTTTSVSTIGTAPTGSSATYSQTFNTVKQATNGNSLTLTLSNWEGYTISNITLSMKSNKTGGAGTLSYSTDGSTYSFIVGASGSGVAFSDASWHGSYTNEYVNVSKDVEIEASSSDIVIMIAATTNSLYCQSYTITYDVSSSSSAEATTTTINSTGITNTNIFNGVFAGSLSATVTDELDNAVEGAIVTWSSSDEDVATVNSSTGEVTLVAEGTTTITASYAGVDGVYKSSSDTYELTVTNEDPSLVTIWSEDFSGYSKDDVPDGGTYSYVCVDGNSSTKIYSDSAAGGESPELLINKKGTNNGSFSATIPLGDNGYVGTLKLKFKNNNPIYVSAQANTGTMLKSSTSISSNTTTGNTVSIPGVTAEMTSVTIKWTNSTSTNVRIDDIKLKGKEAPVKPSFSVDSKVFDSAFDMTISSAEGTTLKYTTDGTNPASSGTAVVVDSNSETITIPTGSNATVKAVTISSGNVSRVSTVTYTYDNRTTPEFSLSSTAVALKVNQEGTVTLTTDYDGTITATSSNATDMPVSYNSSTKVCTFTPNQAGSYTISFSATGSDNYKDAAAEVSVTVTKKGTTMVLTPSFTSKDIYVAKTGSLTGTPTYNESSIDGAEVTYTSSDEKVATIADNGTVTFKKAGSTTIKASYEGDDEYEACEAEYVLELVDTTPQETEVSISLNNTFFDCDAFTSYAKESPTSYEASKKNITVTYDKGTGSGFYCNDTGLRLYTGGSLTFAAPAGYVITKIVLSGQDGFYEGLTNPEASTTWTGNASTVSITGETKKESTRKNMTDATVTLAETVTVGSAGYTTYVTKHDVEFPTGVTGDIATEINTSTVHLEEKASVPAATPIVVKAAAGTYALPAIDTTPDDVSGNILQASDGTVTSDGSYYALAKLDDNVGFYQVEDGVIIPAGKAYLVDGAGVKGFTFDFEEDATGIEKALSNSPLKGENIYNLAGQRLQKMQKGINIVNGKKVLK